MDENLQSGSARLGLQKGDLRASIGGSRTRFTFTVQGRRRAHSGGLRRLTDGLDPDDRCLRVNALESRHHHAPGKGSTAPLDHLGKLLGADCDVTEVFTEAEYSPRAAKRLAVEAKGIAP
jgi:hypothetical protein